MSFKIQSSKKNPTTFRKSPMDGSWSPTMTDAIRSFLSKVGKNGVEEVFDVALIEEAPALKAAAKESGVRGRYYDIRPTNELALALGLQGFEYVSPKKWQGHGVVLHLF